MEKFIEQNKKMHHFRTTDSNAHKCCLTCVRPKENYVFSDEGNEFKLFCGVYGDTLVQNTDVCNCWHKKIQFVN